MAGNKLTIKLSDDQEKQVKVKDAPAWSISELNIDLAGTGGLAEKNLGKVAGGIAGSWGTGAGKVDLSQPLLAGSIYCFFRGKEGTRWRILQY